MSRRTEADVTFAAELKAAHLAQIEALTAPGLGLEERVERFMDAARFSGVQRQIICAIMERAPYLSAARICWVEGDAPWSLFGNMPGCCGCPVREVQYGHHIDGIPNWIFADWSPTAEDLLPFARIQQKRRLG